MAEEYLTIPLTQGMTTRVSPHRFEELIQWKWCAHLNASGNHYYAERVALVGGARIHIKMHRLILGLEKGDPREGDHINGDSLDNRDGNLRIAGEGGNAANSKIRKNNTSGFKGVSWHKRVKKYGAHVNHAGRKLFVGYFDDPRAASEARNALAQQLHGEFYSAR